MQVDPLRHPDLARLGRRLRATLDDTLDAEQEAARAVALRRRSLRDVLLEAEDRGSVVVITTPDAVVHRGIVEAVGLDHVAVAAGLRTRYLALDGVVSLEVL